jgi:hypothetical protein
MMPSTGANQFHAMRHTVGFPKRSYLHLRWEQTNRTYVATGKESEAAVYHGCFLIYLDIGLVLLLQ